MNILIIGLGSIAQKHIQALRELVPDVKFYALRSGNSTNNVDDVKNIYKLEELDCKPDFVIVSNPTSEHYATLKNVVSLRCPLFIEKPAIDDLEKGKELEELFKQYNTQTYVGLSLRFLPCLNFLREIVSSAGRINEVNVYCGSYLPDWRPGTDFRKNYSACAEMGGGVHLDLIHELDYVYWLFGLPKHSSRTVRNVSSLDISAYDYANYILEYDTFTVNVVLNYYRRDARRSCEIITADDTWTVDLIMNEVRSYKKGILFNSDFNREENYRLQMKHFLDCLSQKKKQMNSFDDSLKVLKMCLNETT